MLHSKRNAMDQYKKIFNVLIIFWYCLRCIGLYVCVVYIFFSFYLHGEKVDQNIAINSLYVMHADMRNDGLRFTQCTCVYVHCSSSVRIAQSRH